MITRDLGELQPFLRPLPTVEECFVGDLAQYDRYFVPLLSVEANIIDPDWKGLLHFVTPKEPEDCLVGEWTKEFHSGYNRTGWVAFKRTQDRYTFLGDWRFFEWSDAGKNQPSLEEHYAKVDTSLAETRANFARLGLLSQYGKSRNWYEQLAGEPEASNWCNNAKEISIEYVRAPSIKYGEKHSGVGGFHDVAYEIAYPLTHDGRRFRYVGWLQGFNYHSGGADGVLLFYDPQEEVALIAMNYT